MAGLPDELAALRAQVAALTARVYALEQGHPKKTESAAATARVVQPEDPVSQASVALGDAPSNISAPPPPDGPAVPSQPSPVASVRVHAAPPLRPSLSHSSQSGGDDLEKKIGQYWLNRIGIAAMLIGLSYFLKYAFENNWIGPGGRIAIGLVLGIAVILWSERFRRAGYSAFSYSLKAVGIGALYLSLWGAFQVYHLIPAAAAFGAMVIVTGSTIALALTQDAELLASFAMVGGFATPILLSTGESHEAALFSYVALLDLAILVMTVIKPWRRLLWGSFLGTIILYVGWFGEYYQRYQNEDRALTTCFAASFAAIFASVPLLAAYSRSSQNRGPSITLTVLPLCNAATFFLELFAMHERDKDALTWFALSLAAIYLGIAEGIRRRAAAQGAGVIQLAHVAIAIAFLTIAIPLKLDAHWITIGWLVESAVLLWVSVRTETNFLRYLALITLLLGIVRLLVYDNFKVETILVNARFLSYAVAISILCGIAHYGKRYASESEQPFVQLAVVAVNVLALIALTWEAADYFDRVQVAHRYLRNEFREIAVLRSFTYSAIWLVYGAVLMAVGFQTRSAFLRWQALILIALTTLKVFLYDVSQLGGSYRIVSFVALGAVLLGISFVYQRDWLRLSADDRAKVSSANRPAQGHS
jgi:uncharacterized membrane protein